VRRPAATVALVTCLAVGGVLLGYRFADDDASLDAGAPPAPTSPPASTPAQAETEKDLEPVMPRIVWRRSTAVGLPWRGRLENGVMLPAEGRDFFTWDPIRERRPNRSWRRVGHHRLVRLLLSVAAAHRAAHPDAPRVAVGDLSRSRGGDFGPRYGLPGHVSHQNGLDADVFYPRLDRREVAPEHAGEIDRELAQDLVDRFVRAGALRVFVGPNTGLRGNPRVVQPLVRHDNHLHVRIGG
jgi:murein endopeptidase